MNPVVVEESVVSRRCTGRHRKPRMPSRRTLSVVTGAAGLVVAVTSGAVPLPLESPGDPYERGAPGARGAQTAHPVALYVGSGAPSATGTDPGAGPRSGAADATRSRGGSQPTSGAPGASGSSQTSQRTASAEPSAVGGATSRPAPSSSPAPSDGDPVPSDGDPVPSDGDPVPSLPVPLPTAIWTPSLPDGPTSTLPLPPLLP
jgi:hypothetical protein